jgi:hypothetical protein
VIDSFGIRDDQRHKKECQIESDLAAVDAQQIATLGRLSRCVAERGYIFGPKVSRVQIKQRDKLFVSSTLVPRPKSKQRSKATNTPYETNVLPANSTAWNLSCYYR